MILFIDAILEPALWWAADWSLRWAVLLAAVALLLWIARPRRAALRQMLLLAALAAGLLLPFAPRWGEGWDFAATQSVADVRSHAERGNEEDSPPPPSLTAPSLTLPRSHPASFPRSAWERTSGRSASRLVEEPDATPSMSAMRSQPEREIERNEPLGRRRLIILGVVSFWSFAVAWQLMRCFCGWMFLLRLRRQAVEAMGATADLFASCRAELQVWSAVRLAAHPHVRSPILLGLWRPLIVVPPDWPERGTETQRAGLLHELAHVRRRDHWLVPLLEIVRIAFFFHPFVRRLLARLEQERELLCDEMVVGRGIDPRAYARLLVELARSSGRLAWPAVSLPMGRRRTVKDRIHHLLEEDMERWIRPLPLPWAVVLGAGLLALMLGLASYQVMAVEKDKPDPDNKAAKQPAASKPEAEPKREKLCYDGKDFNQWRATLLMELKPTIRIEGLTALAAFGANGYEVEATQAILHMMRGYNPEQFTGADVQVVREGHNAIQKIGVAAVPALTAAVEGENRNARRFAIKSLGRFGSDAQASIPVLLRAFKSNDLGTSLSAIEAVGAIDGGTKDVVAALNEALSDKRKGVKLKAVNALGKIGESAKPAIPALLTALSDKDDAVRGDAIAALKKIGAGARAVPAISRLLQDEDDKVAHSAFQYLDHLKPEEIVEAVPGLIAALKSPNWVFRALDQLTRIGPAAKEAVPALTELLRSRHLQTSQGAMQALEKIGREAKR